MGKRTGLTLIVFEPTRLRGFDNHELVGFPLRCYMWLRSMLPIPSSWL